MYQVFTSNGSGMSLVQELALEADAIAAANTLGADGVTFVQVERREGGMSTIVLKLNEPQPVPPPAADPAPANPVV